MQKSERPTPAMFEPKKSGAAREYWAAPWYRAMKRAPGKRRRLLFRTPMRFYRLTG